VRGPPLGRGEPEGGHEGGSEANAGFCRAAANSAALANRSAGSFSNARVTAAATFGGTDFRTCVTSCASSVTIFMMICCADEPTWGGFPASISYSTLARL
jgi:hypothetical protein